jgi:hypothetical protein
LQITASDRVAVIGKTGTHDCVDPGSGITAEPESSGVSQLEAMFRRWAKGFVMPHKTLLPVLCFGLAACASTPENLFVPVAQTVPGASSVDMLVATTGRAVANPGELFSGERGYGLSFANIVVSVPPNRTREAGEIQ